MAANISFFMQMIEQTFSLRTYYALATSFSLIVRFFRTASRSSRSDFAERKERLGGSRTRKRGKEKEQQLGREKERR